MIASFSSAYGRNRFGSFQPIRASRFDVCISDAPHFSICDPLNSVGGVYVISSPDHFFSPQLLQQFGGDFVQSFQSTSSFHVHSYGKGLVKCANSLSANAKRHST